MGKALSCALILLLLCANAAQAAQTRTITDGYGRAVTIPAKVERVICSGPGCLRLLVYLQAQGMAVAADDIESRRNAFDARPYALAHPELRTLPVFGQFRGSDNPERILTLSPAPQVILKTSPEMGVSPQDLERKTGIPVVALNYGDLGKKRPDFFASLRIMAQVVHRQERAEALVRFFDAHIAELGRRAAKIPGAKRPSAFVGGVALKGPHGFNSTEPGYPPFLFLNARNVAALPGAPGVVSVAKEKVLEWNPDFLFLDLSTLQLGEGAGGLHELKADPAYKSLSAVRQGRVFGVLPYNWYSQNFGSILADAYFVGKTLYPDQFKDVRPEAKADEIYTFLVGKPVYREMDAAFHGLAFKPLDLR
ncbi:iron complex transport system substrate-binding protein [Humidesulfovibrio mexicanus]|uniref:Iron complex transport system substrate-binding protein n=1 Tax=Humidesulfovibrio mexicanus TaxID=147047 RepID=A0A238Z417_9BACT|nr:iron ABC transporter substrate-binding protein [Humidesulfovibrio mexicanus]SNR78097.1 iron complex transport system substrate-binding protein [Humidesulfovibrio mexicanus]